MGSSGTGNFTQSGGTNTMSNYTLSLGDSRWQQRNLQSQWDRPVVHTYEFVGHSGTGNFTQSGGTNTISTAISMIGSGSGSSGTYNLSGPAHCPQG